MFKKIVLFALLLVPAGMFAQEAAQKIAYFNSQEVIMAMPETLALQDSVRKQASAFEAELKILEEEFNKKFVAFQSQQDTLIESIKIRRQQELADLNERATALRQQAGQTIEKLQQDLLAPIEKKVRDALTAVGEENGFAYIIDSVSGVLVYTSTKSPDATPLVRKKLGLK